MKKCYIEPGRKKILHTIKGAGNWVCLILRRDCLVKKKNLLKEKLMEREDKEEDVSIY